MSFLVPLKYIYQFLWRWVLNAVYIEREEIGVKSFLLVWIDMIKIWFCNVNLISITSFVQTHSCKLSFTQFLSWVIFWTSESFFLLSLGFFCLLRRQVTRFQYAYRYVGRSTEICSRIHYQHEKDVPGFTATHYYILKYLRAAVKKGLCFCLCSLRWDVHGHKPCLSPLLGASYGAWSKYSYFPYGWHPNSLIIGSHCDSFPFASEDNTFGSQIAVFQEFVVWPDFRWMSTERAKVTTPKISWKYQFLLWNQGYF